MKTNIPSYKTGTLMAKRNRNIAIMEAVARHTYVVIDYEKITTNERLQYKIVPMKWSYRQLKVGLKKVLYAQDMNEDFKTKSFVHVNILKVLIGKKSVRPKNYMQEIYIKKDFLK